jgi:Ca2+-binding RTX toxin-like protein
MRADLLFGGLGSDVVHGNAGDDKIHGRGADHTKPVGDGADTW